MEFEDFIIRNINNLLLFGTVIHLVIRYSCSNLYDKNHIDKKNMFDCSGPGQGPGGMLPTCEINYPTANSLIQGFLSENCKAFDKMVSKMARPSGHSH